MSHVQVGGVPSSASPGELRALFEQCGAVRQLVCQFEAGAAEGSALVAFADVAAAREAADLLDSYPLGTSLLEVQPVSPDQFVGRLVSSILAARDPWTGKERDQPAAAGEPAGVAALEAEMRELQLQLQQQADSVQDAAAAALAQRQQQQREQAAAASAYHAQLEGQEQWQEAAPRSRRPQHLQQQQQQHSASQQRNPAAGDAGGEGPNTGLWVGWIGLNVEEEDLCRAFSRWGPVQVERLQAADRLADNGKRYKWGILRYKDVSHAVAAKRATERQHLPGVTVDAPLKVVFYQPGHAGRGRGKA